MGATGADSKHLMGADLLPALVLMAVASPLLAVFMLAHFLPPLLYDTAHRASL